MTACFKFVYLPSNVVVAATGMTVVAMVAAVVP